MVAIRSHKRPDQIVKTVDRVLDVIGLETQLLVFVSPEHLWFRALWCLGCRAYGLKFGVDAAPDQMWQLSSTCNGSDKS